MVDARSADGEVLGLNTANGNNNINILTCVYYYSVLGKRPCTSFQGVNEAASIQTYS